MIILHTLNTDLMEEDTSVFLVSAISVLQQLFPGLVDATFPMSKDGVSGATIQETGAGRGGVEVRRRKEASQLLKDPHWMDDGDLKATTTGHVGNSPKCSYHYVTLSNQFD